METSIEEVSYSALVQKICRKAKVDETMTELKLSYVPESVHPKRPIHIHDDDDLMCYLEMNPDQFQVLHVEVVNDVEINQGDEQSRGTVGCSLNEELISSSRATYENTMYEGEPSERFEMMENSDGNMVLYQEQSEERAIADNCDMIEGSEVTPVVNREWEDGLDLTLRQEFESKQAVKDLVEKAAHKNCFEFVIVKSDTMLFVVKCCEFKRGCKWSLRAARNGNSDSFSVRTYNKTHTCLRSDTSTMRRKRRGTPHLVASVLREDYPCLIDTPTPKNLIPLVQSRVGVKVSYSTANRGKKLAAYDLRGTPEDSFKLVHCYMHMLQTMNPGTISFVELDEAQRFKYLFFALGACIEGFKAMRKVIIVDATSIKNVYGGVLIVATAQDPDHHHYPIAFGVVDGEKDTSWTWFFSKLKSVVPDCPELVFCSDRNQSLIKSINTVYPLSHHGYCIYHLSQNVKLSCKNVNRDLVATKFMECAKAYTEPEFEKLYADFIRRYPAASTYLDNHVGQNKWARCYFPGARYNIDTTNTVESINGVFRFARAYPLLPMIDAIVSKVAEWFNKYRKISLETPKEQKLVPFVETLMHTRCSEAKLLPVTELNSYFLEYSVTGVDGSSYVVDLRRKTCYCKQFDIDRYPCVHAIVAAMEAARNAGNEIQLHDLCSKYYWMEQWALGYSRTIYPVPIMSMWMVPDDVRAKIVLPKFYVTKRGRKPTKRIPSA
ncbi:PREDICTED: protein FAR1-RELATED SEQUENCE 8-like [Camelina sativa]|uniref:Protein FAR1-RELATED SEQUENCE 8-like n=1 Tax=Camelina sativa TaxID=90675 RepID=A0ABM0TDK3_CAMSA|nr:PREDICTED: protein FAR1-RELATED SEQUENCE 8-like [Camelina sativa]